MKLVKEYLTWKNSLHKEIASLGVTVGMVLYLVGNIYKGQKS